MENTTDLLCLTVFCLKVQDLRFESWPDYVAWC